MDLNESIGIIKYIYFLYPAYLIISFFFLITLFISNISYSRTLYVNPGESISDIIELSENGDTIIINKGTYNQRFIIDRSLSIIGKDFPVIDGGDKGSIIKVTAPNTVIKGLKIRGTGSSLSVEDAGIDLEDSPNSLVENNILENVLFGIYLKNSPGSSIINNKITGKDLPLPERGDGIRLWYSSEAEIIGNTINNSRDLVIWWSSNTKIKKNKVSNGRYGLHYMYSNNNIFEDNIFTGNAVGGFLMYSNNIRFLRNTFSKNKGMASGYGIGFKDLDDVYAEDNLFIDNRVGIYMDNSPNLVSSWNELTNNIIAYNDIGISMMPSIERNKFHGNSFIENYEQVEVRGGGILKGNKWNISKRGNYWSDYLGFDENNDGIGDSPYKSEKLFEHIIDRNKALRIFVYSPVTKAIELASEAFPVIKPKPKLVDNLPLINPEIPIYLGQVTRNKPLSFLVFSIIMLIIPAIYFLIFIRQKDTGTC